MQSEDSSPIEIPIAALNQYSYCPHRCWRMFCVGEFVDNQYTIEGTSLHERVHTLGAGLRDEVHQVRAIWLRSQRYGLVGKSDLVETQAGQIYPVEYKRGKRGEFGNDALQVCAQALCLEEMTGQAIALGYLYYAHSHQRLEVPLTPALRTETLETLEAVRQLLTTGTMPLPVYGPRCKGCSLYEACLPQAAAKISQYRESP
jgi:CRISPR-associated exonuclease Cas4